MSAPPRLAVINEDPTSVACDALLVAAFADGGSFTLDRPASVVDEAVGNRLSDYLTSSGFKGGPGELVVVPGGEGVTAGAVAVLGLGDHAKADTTVVRRAAGSAARSLRERSTVAVAIDGSGPESATTVAEGLLLGAYRFTTYKTDPKPSRFERALVVDGDEDALNRASIVAEATWLARDLVNEPASTLTPDVLAQRAKEAGDVSGFQCAIWDEDELETHGFGGLLGVASGSVNPPRFIQMHYAPESPTAKVALVGKGVTFDSGGLSLKDAANMETMKTDMGGAAAVIAAMSAIAKLKPQVEVLAFVPTTENMPSGTAVRPGDVLKHFGGKTTEVLNTDAEGRLILADALAFASEQKPDAIVDVATLTGSIMVALGKKATGLFSNDDTLASELEAASEAAGEAFWRMPIYDSYKKELESEVADLKNVGSRWGGAIIAALFLREFVGEGIPWAHLDIAGAARADSDYDENPKGGTGVAVRTLVNWVEGRALERK
jgi:leucyl aminopeptidase